MNKAFDRIRMEVTRQHHVSPYAVLVHQFPNVRDLLRAASHQNKNHIRPFPHHVANTFQQHGQPLIVFECARIQNQLLALEPVPIDEIV